MRELTGLISRFQVGRPEREAARRPREAPRREVA